MRNSSSAQRVSGSDTEPAYNSLIELSKLAIQAAESLDVQIDQAAELMVECLRVGNKILVCGNGGSAADAQHFAAELVGKMARQRRALPAISLAVDPSTVTALGNDYGFENVFARQVEALGNPGDILLAISTSGHSSNVLKALAAAQSANLNTVALLGEGGDASLDDCDISIRIPSCNSQRVQELHMAVLHIICEHIEAQF